MTRILFTVSNDINYDQRMIKICSSLQEAGFEVCLLGFRKKQSKDLNPQNFEQERLSLFFKKGKLFYLEVQLRLFFKLLFSRFDILCAVDMDTILPAFLVSKIKSKHLVFDAHEYYSETSGLVGRSMEKRIWQSLENFIIPKVSFAYTVNRSLADIFQKNFKTKFSVIRNLPILKIDEEIVQCENFFLYQGALNKGRGLIEILNVFKENDLKLKIAGDGPMKNEVLNFIKTNNLEDRIEYLGWLNPDELLKLTKTAIAGLNLIDGSSLSYYYSLANKFSDYFHSGIPQISMNFPEYRAINEDIEVAILIDDFDQLNSALIEILKSNKRKELQENTILARRKYNWNSDEKVLIGFYEGLLASSK